MNEKNVKQGLENLINEFGDRKIKSAIEAVKNFEVEIPSWVFGNFGGGRFGGYTPPGGARNINEKLDDAAYINKLTGATPRVATHILWDFSKDGYTPDYNIAKSVAKECRQRKLELGAINPTYFLRGSYRGSLSSDEKNTIKYYADQTILGGKIASELANNVLALWFPDGSSYPGQRDLRRTFENLRNALKTIRAAVPEQVRILIEYKVFEPGTYSTTVPDYGTSALLSLNMGANTGALVDLGHHHQGTNIEQIVAMLIAQKIPSGFHFNTRYSADDDHSVEPNPQNTRIFYELISGDVIFNKDKNKNWGFMIDQASSRENRMHAVLHSIDSLHICLAKAMLVDDSKLDTLQKKDEIILANRFFNNATLHADVRPIVAQARMEKGLPADPVQAYYNSGYQKKIESERK